MILPEKPVLAVLEIKAKTAIKGKAGSGFAQDFPDPDNGDFIERIWMFFKLPDTDSVTQLWDR